MQESENNVDQDPILASEVKNPDSEESDLSYEE